MIKWNKTIYIPEVCPIFERWTPRTYEVGDEKLPSVTTILGQTQSDEKRESLAKWIAKKGENEAESYKE